MNINTLELLRVLTDNGLINHTENIYSSVSNKYQFYITSNLSSPKML